MSVVPGVSSLTACAAAAHWPLSARGDALLVLPASLSEQQLLCRLAEVEAAAVIKLGRHFAKVRAVIERLELAANSRYVERASLGEERVLALGAVDPERVPYFSMVLLHRRGAAWR